MGTDPRTGTGDGMDVIRSSGQMIEDAPVSSTSSTLSAVIRALVLAAVLASAFAIARWTPLADWLHRDLIIQKLLS